MRPQPVTYGPFGWRWGFGALALLCGASAVGSVYLVRDTSGGASLRCTRRTGAPIGSDPGQHVRCRYRKGSRRSTFTLAGVRSFKVLRGHKSQAYTVYLVYADGRTQYTLPNGRAVQHRFGPTDEATARDAARRLERFLANPHETRLALDLPAHGGTVALMFLLLVLLPALSLYTAFHALRARTRFTVERGTGPHTLTVRRRLLGVFSRTWTVSVQGATRVEVERGGLDRLLALLDAESLRGGRIVFRDDTDEDADVPLAVLTGGYYPGTREHEVAAEALRELLSLPRG